jgi:HEAT repeat protein
MISPPPLNRVLVCFVGVCLLGAPSMLANDPPADSSAPPPPSERIRLVVEAGRRGADGLPTVLAGLADNDSGVRAAAVQVAWSVGGIAELERIAPLIDDVDERVSLAAASGMVGIDDPAVVPHVVRCLAECRPSVRAQLAGRIGDERDARFVDALGGMLSAENPGLRRTALQALQALGSAEAFPHLMRGTSDGDVRVAEVAIGALARLGDPRAAQRIVALCGSEDEQIRAAAAAALPSVASASEHAELLIKLLNDPSPRVPSLLLRSIRDHYSPAALPILEKAATLENARLRRSVAMALDGGTGDEGRELLARLAADEDEFVRSAAIQTVGERGLTALAPRLAAAVDDPSPTVRTTLATALGALGGAPALQALASLATDGDAGVRSAVATAAAGLPADFARNLLTPMLQDEDTGVRVVTVRSLARVGDEASVAAMRRAISDRDVAVRVAALVEVARIGDRGAIEAVRAALSDPAEPVRTAARNAMSALRQP